MTDYLRADYFMQSMPQLFMCFYKAPYLMEVIKLLALPGWLGI